MKRWLFLLAAALALPALAADKFPSRPIRVIVPYNAGGQTDTIARHAASGAALVGGFLGLAFLIRVGVE